jgi:uncharacterized protein YabE (DUF348 family)
VTSDIPSRLRPRRRGPRFWAVLAVSGLILVTTLALVANRLTQKTVTLDISGQVHRYHVRGGTVQDVLHEANVLLDPEDVVWPAPQTSLRDGMTITVHKAFAVALQVNGDVRHVRTQATHPLDVLAEQSIPVGPYDVIQVNGQSFSPEQLRKLPWNVPATSIRVVHSASLTVIDGARTLVIHTTQADVGRALDAAGVTLYLADQVTPDLSTPVVDGLVVLIQRSVPVTVAADGREIATRALGPTVGDALAEVRIAPIGLDYTIPPADSPLQPDMTIRLVRVSEETVTAENPLPYSTLYRPDPTLGPDDERLIQPGVDGLLQQEIVVRYEDGQEVSRTVKSERIAQPPVPRIIAYGRASP